MATFYNRIISCDVECQVGDLQVKSIEADDDDNFTPKENMIPPNPDSE